MIRRKTHFAPLPLILPGHVELVICKTEDARVLCNMNQCDFAGRMLIFDSFGVPKKAPVWADQVTELMQVMHERWRVVTVRKCDLDILVNIKS